MRKIALSVEKGKCEKDSITVRQRRHIGTHKMAHKCEKDDAKVNEW